MVLAVSVSYLDANREIHSQWLCACTEQHLTSRGATCFSHPGGSLASDYREHTASPSSVLVVVHAEHQDRMTSSASFFLPGSVSPVPFTALIRLAGGDGENLYWLSLNALFQSKTIKRPLADPGSPGKRPLTQVQVLLTGVTPINTSS